MKTAKEVINYCYQHGRIVNTERRHIALTDIKQLEAQLQQAKDDNDHAADENERLKNELAIAKKCNSCMSRQIDKLTDEPLSCNPIGDECDQDWRDNKQIADLESRLTDLEWRSVEDARRLELEKETENCSVDVLVKGFISTGEEVVDIGWYNFSAKAWEDGGDNIVSFTHWMPITLPAQPASEKPAFKENPVKGMKVTLFPVKDGD